MYLEKDAKRLVEDEVENFSKWVNEKIYTCLSCETVEDVLAKKKEMEGKLRTLDHRLKELRARDSKVGSGKKVEIRVMAELRETFSLRMEQEQSREENLGWILSPKNIGRCKLLGKNPEAVLDELEAWYDGVQKGNVKED